MPRTRRTRAQSDFEEETTGGVPNPPIMDPQQLLQLLAQALSTQGLSSRNTGPPQNHAPSVKSLPTPKLQSPDNLTIPQFRDWKQRWKDYSLAQQLLQQHLPTQHGILRSALDPEWTMLWNSSRLHINEESTVDDIITSMEGYLRKKRNPLLDRQEFHRRDQQPGESVDHYYAALKCLDDACDHVIQYQCECDGICTTNCQDCEVEFPLANFLQETRIRDRLICGLLDKEMQRKVLSEQFTDSLTLDKVLTICSAIENSNQAGASLTKAPVSTPAVDAASKSTYKKKNKPPGGNKQNQSSSTSTATSQQNPDKPCRGCGKPANHNRRDCPAWDKTCNTCKKKGHFSSACFRKTQTNAPAQQTTQSSTTSQPQPNASNTIATAHSNQQLLQIATHIGDSPFYTKWLPDTGADVDAISLRDIKRLCPDYNKHLTPTSEDVVAANGLSLGPVGTIKATFRLNNRAYQTTIGVFNNVTTPLLSKRGCIALGLLEPDWPVTRIDGEPDPSSSLYAITTGNQEVQLPQTPRSVAANTREALIKEFQSVFDDSTLHPMKGDPMKIELVEGAVPCRRYKAYDIPFHWRDKVKSQLDSMVLKGIIEPVPVGEAYDWCHPMVVVPKKGTSEPRITVDLTGLNKVVRRPAYPVKVPKAVVARIPPGRRYFTTLDFRHGYWQIMLDEDSMKLTTFITPFGPFRFRRNIMGLISAGDESNRRGDEALKGIQCVEKIVEDLLIHDDNFSNHLSIVREVLQRCKEFGITLNPKKFRFAEPEVDWCGFRLTKNGYSPAPHLVSALRDFPVPTSRTDVRSFLGLVQQFEAFSHRITKLAVPIRSLLSASAAFVWETPHQTAFKDIIEELASPRVLTHFEPGRPLRLETDAAQSRGLGYALWQQQPDDQWKLLQTGSRFVTPTESRYSATEIEFLAVVWAVKKCRLFLLGQSFQLIVDHRPLISIINSKTLDEVENPRLQRLKEKLAMYRPYAIWRAGTKHTVVDVFSRYPTSDPDEEDIKFGFDTDPQPLYAAALHDPEDGSAILSDPILIGVKEASESCMEHQRLRELIRLGFPEKAQLDDDLHPYFQVRDNLTFSEGLIFLGSRILIPTHMRSSVLQMLHGSHQGQERTLRRARQAVFWPGMTNDIKNVVKTCRECASFLPSQQKEPMKSEPASQYPFQHVAVDLFSYAGIEHLSLVDRFSGWPLIAKCGTSASSGTVIHHLKDWMTAYGIPEQLSSDNGPQFSSFEFQNWTKKFGIRHVTSSPHYPQSNGLAESGVKSLKYLLAKSALNGDISSDSFQQGLLELRNTPRAHGRSPAQLLFGAPIRSTLPLHRSKFLECWKHKSQQCDEKAISLKEKARQQYDFNAKSLPRLQRDDIVLVQDPQNRRWSTIAKIIEVKGRSCLVKTESGRLLRRNRRFLRRFVPTETPEDDLPQPSPPLRRSLRSRRPPQRFVNSIRCDPGSHLKGGHVVRVTIPHIIGPASAQNEDESTTDSPHHALQKPNISLITS